MFTGTHIRGRKPTGYIKPKLSPKENVLELIEKLISGN